MTSFNITEKSLQDQLRNICDSNGRETNPQASAAIFDKLALHYRKKSPDKINLIQSAALFNAAIVRQPSDQKYRDHLLDLCDHVLDCSKAERRNKNLLQVSKVVAREVEIMRKNAKSILSNIEKVTGFIQVELN